MEWWVVLALILTAIAFFFLGRMIARAQFTAREREIRKDAVERSRSVVRGQFSEQLAPFLPDFIWKPTESKFLGNPVDLIVFEGLDERKITKVTFVEVKSGKASLNATERSLKKAVEAGSVEFAEYRVPEEVTHGS